MMFVFLGDWVLVDADCCGVDMPLALLSNLDGYLSYPMQPNETEMGETILILLSISIANFVSKCIMSPFAFKCHVSYES